MKGNKRVKKPVIYGQLGKDDPAFRKSPLSVFYYTYRFVFEDSYPAKFNGDFCRDMVLLYSNVGETVLDPFCGSGIALVEAAKIGRKAVGLDVNPIAIDICKKMVEHHKVEELVQIQMGDSRSLDLEDNSVDLILTSPPFGLSIDAKHPCYSESRADLGNCKTYDTFREEMKKCWQEFLRVVKPNGIMVVEVSDRCKDKKFRPLGAYFTSDAESVGWEPWTWGIEILPSGPYQKWPHGDQYARRFLPSHYNILIFRKPLNDRLDKHLGE